METTKVLIADDDEMIRNLYSTAFTKEGVQVITAENGLECVELALEHHPDAILTDIMMPKLSGHDAIEMIRRDDWGKNAKVVYLTNLSDAENVVYAVEKGTEKYIVKANTDVKEVINIVRAAMHAE
jgi:CheY-like chemotaxis protein